MSLHPARKPSCHEYEHTLERIVATKPKDIGGFTVRRALPTREQRSLGPFVFFDEMGPANLAESTGIDVRPHPHIGIATVTYLLEGAFLHRDSLNSRQVIEPGAVNWMTAGRGIVHSERTPDDMRARSDSFHGIQTWLALPTDQEEAPPDFQHYPRDTLPEFREGDADIRLLAGSAYGKSSPVRTPSQMFYAFALLDEHSALRLPDEHPERGVYPLDGPVRCNDELVTASSLAVVEPSRSVTLTCDQPCRVMLLGGSPLEPSRFMEWNFVSSRRERIDQAKQDWRDGKFAMIEGDPEWIPLPEDQ